VEVWRQGRVRAVERIESPLEADARVLDHLSRLGCDPTEPRECRHYLYVPGEIGAEEVARSLNATDGWDAEYEQVADLWLVTATTFTGLNDTVLRDTRQRFEALADIHRGEYDGWEAAAD
jgi:hypothetical protein